MPTAESVIAIVPCHRAPPVPGLLEALAAEIGGVLVVSDGMPAEQCAALDAAVAAVGAEIVRLPGRFGKGHAVAAGIAALPARYDAVLVVDADGQHPPAAIPGFLAAAEHADLVIGDRFAHPEAMPLERRVANRIASRLVARSERCPVRDSQCGMRLLQRRALHAIPFPPGGMEAETTHLKRCLRAGVAVAWVPIPAIYQGQPSAFRPIRDSIAVVRAALA
jgi:glycosyltransferase involved in cell wall biosynthesis